MCRLLGVSTSGYYAWRHRKPSKRSVEDARLTELIVRIHKQSQGTYGYPRVHAMLNRQGVRCSKKRVARLMKNAGVEGVSRRKRRGTIRRNPHAIAAPDLVKRRFTADAPNKLWVADITQHATGEGWLYVAGVIDVFSRMVVGWSMSERATSALVVDALNMAVRVRGPEPGLIHHSDQGAQYTSFRFGYRLHQAGILGSMGTAGDAYDNALSESFWASLQTELLDRYTWRTRAELRSAVFQYIEVFYNRQRLHSALGYLSPLEFEQEWEAMQRREKNLIA